MLAGSTLDWVQHWVICWIQRLLGNMGDAPLALHRSFRSGWIHLVRLDVRQSGNGASGLREDPLPSQKRPRVAAPRPL
jgi:hypothetical protein